MDNSFPSFIEKLGKQELFKALNLYIVIDVLGNNASLEMIALNVQLVAEWKKRFPNEPPPMPQEIWVNDWDNLPMPENEKWRVVANLVNVRPLAATTQPRVGTIGFNQVVEVIPESAKTNQGYIWLKMAASTKTNEQWVAQRVINGVQYLVKV